MNPGMALAGLLLVVIGLSIGVGGAILSDGNGDVVTVGSVTDSTEPVASTATTVTTTTTPGPTVSASTTTTTVVTETTAPMVTETTGSTQMSETTGAEVSTTTASVAVTSTTRPDDGAGSAQAGEPPFTEPAATPFEEPFIPVGVPDLTG